MSPEERKREFDMVFESIHGTNIERIRKVCSILHYKENTVRILRMKHGAKVIPERMLNILKLSLEENKTSTGNKRTIYPADKSDPRLKAENNQ